VVDLGTGATAEAVVAALQLVLARPDVRCVLLNVFAGFNRCDHVAEGIVRTMKGGEVALPVVVRLNGTKVRDGLSLLRESGVAVSSTTSLDEAIAMVVDSCSDGDGGQR
jgi:succinyl-CoA synthetase beta subunit